VLELAVDGSGPGVDGIDEGPGNAAECVSLALVVVAARSLALAVAASAGGAAASTDGFGAEPPPAASVCPVSPGGAVRSSPQPLKVNEKQPTPTQSEQALVSRFAPRNAPNIAREYGHSEHRTSRLWALRSGLRAKHRFGTTRFAPPRTIPVESYVRRLSTSPTSTTTPSPRSLHDELRSPDGDSVPPRTLQETFTTGGSIDDVAPTAQQPKLGTAGG
jgi:hypothetical protein